MNRSLLEKKDGQTKDLQGGEGQTKIFFNGKDRQTVPGAAAGGGSFLPPPKSTWTSPPKISAIPPPPLRHRHSSGGRRCSSNRSAHRPHRPLQLKQHVVESLPLSSFARDAILCLSQKSGKSGRHVSAQRRRSASSSSASASVVGSHR